MRHWSQLATRNWRAKPVRTAAIIVAIALGASAVVWVTCCFESVRRAVTAWAVQYVGTSQVTVESPLGKYDTISQRLVTSLAGLPEVENLTARLVQRLRGLPIGKAEFESRPDFRLKWTDEIPEVDFHGLDVPREYEIRKYDLRAGRLLQEGDEYVCVLEASWADELKLGLDDYVLIWGGARPDDQPVALKIVGLMERRRVARFQKAQALLPLKILQSINLKQGMVTTVDIVVRDKTEAGVAAAMATIRNEARKKVANASVRSVKARMQQIETAQSQQEFVLFLLSCVAMLTALFIILSTLSMGMIERIRARVPGVAIRTSFIVGFPGESETEFAELVDFVKAAEFDNVG
ncbi:MAG: ABC transporter permease, partial [Phycisphaerales bacterium]|nr:ABC transporter permease [Phycisphaerales bacterium]